MKIVRKRQKPVYSSNLTHLEISNYHPLSDKKINGKGEKIMDQFYDYILDVSLKERNHFYAIFGGIHSGGFEISCVKIILYLYILYRVEQTR